MKKLRLSPQGLAVSQICYGVWRLNDDPQKAFTSDVIKKIELCLELGITTFDHADIYGNYECEMLFGRALKEFKGLREKMELVTKAGIKLISDKHKDHKIKYYDTSASHLGNSLENSLRLLNTDYIDLFLIHRPDPMMDVEDLSSTLNKFLDSGKVRHIGVSNFSPSQFRLLDSYLNKPLVTNQIQLSCMEIGAFEDGTIDLMRQLKISPMAWSPLGGGDLFKAKTPKALRLQKTLESVGKKHDADIAQTALAFLLNHPAKIVPIIGSNNIERIKSLGAATKVMLSRQEWFEIWQAAKGEEVP